MHLKNTYALTQKCIAEYGISDNKAEQLNLEGVELYNTEQYTKAIEKFKAAYENCTSTYQNKILFQTNLANALNI